MTLRPVSLPMYDADRDAVAAWWRVLATVMRDQGLRAVPDSLEWPSDLNTHWRDPSLLLSQTCGYPLVTGLAASVRVLGAFRYAAPGCRGIGYASALMVRDDDPARSIEDLSGRVAAINDPGSHSGCNALRALVAPYAREGRFFDRWRVSGSHRHSIALVREGRADVAAIDCVTLAGIRRRDAGAIAGLRVLGMTPLAPGLPLITAAATSPADVGRLRRALTLACSDPVHQAEREAVLVQGFEVAEVETWHPVATCRQRALALH